MRINKKGQAESIIILFALLIAIFITAIIVLKVVNVIVTPLSSQVGNVSAQAGAAVSYTQNKFTGFWDTAIILVICANILILFISAFLVDVHPAFIIVYIIAVVFMFIFGNYFLSIVDTIWNNPEFATEVSQLPMLEFLINHIQLVMICIVILSGILMYAKFKFFSQGQGAGGNY